MNLFKVIGSRLYNKIQRELFFNAIRQERDNILPVNMGFLTLLSKDYMRGYPASFYLFFDKMPVITLDYHDLLKLDKKIGVPLIYTCLNKKVNRFAINPRLTSTYCLYSRIRHYSPEAQIYNADMRLWGNAYYVQDDEYVYDPIMLTKCPLDSFQHIYNPKNIKNMTNDIFVEVLDNLITSDKQKGKDDYFQFADVDILDNLYEQANSQESFNENITELRKGQLEQFFKDMDYEYNSGYIQYLIK